MEECHRLTQTLRSENSRLKDVALDLRTRNRDLSEDLIDAAYGMLQEFFSLPADRKGEFVAPGSHGQTGYTVSESGGTLANRSRSGLIGLAVAGSR